MHCHVKFDSITSSPPHLPCLIRAYHLDLPQQCPIPRKSEVEPVVTMKLGPYNVLGIKGSYFC